MYMIIKLHPGTVVIPGLKNGDIIEVACAIDEKWHSSVKVQLHKLGEPKLTNAPEGTIPGLLGGLSDTVTFNYKSTHHYTSNTNYPPNTDVVVPAIAVAATHNGESYMFTGTTGQLMHWSPGAE